MNQNQRLRCEDQTQTCKIEIRGNQTNECQNENKDQADENQILQHQNESLHDKQKLLSPNKTKPDENEIVTDDNEIMIDENETICVQPHFADLACDVFDFVQIKQVLVREWGTLCFG